MITLIELQKFLYDYLYFDKKLVLEKIEQYMCNGLMVKGKEQISRIGFGVSASLELFKKAKDGNCNVIIVHHAFNPPPYNRYDQIYQDRIGFLIENKISLFGYHFLLDAHPEVGNNVQILKIIGAKTVEPYLHHGDPWGWIGEMDGVGLDIVEEKLKPHLSKRAVLYEYGTSKIKRVVVVSGKGAPLAGEMQELTDGKVDLYITGEVHEWNRELFREAGINFIAGGHYATEVFGVKALMEKVKNHFPQLEVVWIELSNEV